MTAFRTINLHRKITVSGTAHIDDPLTYEHLRSGTPEIEGEIVSGPLDGLRVRYARPQLDPAALAADDGYRDQPIGVGDHGLVFWREYLPPDPLD